MRYTESSPVLAELTHIPQFCALTSGSYELMQTFSLTLGILGYIPFRTMCDPQMPALFVCLNYELVHRIIQITGGAIYNYHHCTQEETIVVVRCMQRIKTLRLNHLHCACSFNQYTTAALLPISIN